MLFNLHWCFCLVFDFVTCEQNYHSALEFVLNYWLNYFVNVVFFLRQSYSKMFLGSSVQKINTTLYQRILRFTVHSPPVRTCLLQSLQPGLLSLDQNITLLQTKFFFVVYSKIQFSKWVHSGRRWNCVCIYFLNSSFVSIIIVFNLV